MRLRSYLIICSLFFFFTLPLHNRIINPQPHNHNHKPIPTRPSKSERTKGKKAKKKKKKSHIQRQIQADDIRPRQQLVKAHIRRPGLQALRQPRAIVINHLHPERIRPALQRAPDAAHAQDAEDLALRVVPERGAALPLAAPEPGHPAVEAAQRADNQEHVYVGRGVIGRRWHVGHADGARAAGVYVDLVVPSSWGMIKRGTYPRGLPAPPKERSLACVRIGGVEG